MVKSSSKFDPDTLHVSKQDIFRVVDALIARWKKNRRANAVVIAGATAFKLGVRAIDDEKFQELWTEMINFSNELITYNELKRMRGDLPRTAEFVDLFLAKFEARDFE